MIDRQIHGKLRTSLLDDGKIIILYGPRQTGKTTLVRAVLDGIQLKKMSINADERKYHQPFSQSDLAAMNEVIGDAELLFIDEAQQIPEIGINLKILHDQRRDLKIIATGSSSFDLANRTQESLTGRTRTYRLLPIAINELRESTTDFELKQHIDQYLLYGMYPEVLTMTGSTRKIEHLVELTTAYLYKDVLSFTAIKHSDKVHKLLQLIALQIGSSVSINKLANALDISHETVSHYLDLLEKSFVIFRRPAYSKNLHKEISKMDKIYFYDTGIRNALLENFTSLDLRTDKGVLWENFIVAERLKKHTYQNKLIRSYYWRVYTGAEIDLIEEENGALSAFEIKSNEKRVTAPQSWKEGYPGTPIHTINRNNWLNYVC